MDAVEKIIRPIVEGQIRGFIKEHPSILLGVDWFKPSDDKATTLINSLAKRIVRDLMCPTSRARLAAALLEPRTEAGHSSTVDMTHCGEAGQLGMDTELAESTLTSGNGT